MTKTKTVATLITLATLAAPMMSSSAFADHSHHNQYKPQYSEHMQSHSITPRPFLVFVDVGTNIRKRRDKSPRSRQNHSTNIAMETIARNLPVGIKLIHNRRDADLVIRAHERDFDVNFYVIDRDLENKKYKKSRRHNYSQSAQCGYFHRAYYTEIKEKGIGRYHYDIKMRLKGINHDRFVIDGTASESYRYAINLKAQTNCGLIETHLAPSNKVERQLQRAQSGYKHEVIRDLRREAAQEVGYKLARIIKNQAMVALKSAYGSNPYYEGSAYYSQLR